MDCWSKSEMQLMPKRLKVPASQHSVFIDLHYYYYIEELECGPMPNVMAALPNIGGAFCSMPQSLADAHYQSAVQ